MTGQDSGAETVETGSDECVSVTRLLPPLPNKRELGVEAVWSLSTAKPGNGVAQLRDDNIDTYWQSDGAQPHLINIQFQKRWVNSSLFRTQPSPTRLTS